ncbi:ABC transporter permease subunit [Halococcus sp. IIIV-5B]|uniref:ABC transporter permease subunit n=1 Tax=Halococcus sp. IIIV-5B TaxID=2321230 RepID=UPI000E76DC3F|nr:ABC transporter permease subunit [Halococcus sp. IIIV-5B]RJT07435.1 ABC transporter [Halococcus sp. IIIV-5B]
MSLIVVAKKEFSDSVRSNVLIGLVVLFVLFAGGFTYLFAQVPGILGSESTTASTPALITAMGTAAGLLVPLIGLIVGYKSIVGERASGSLDLLLNLPHTRRDIVLGKLIGRTAVVVVAVLVGFAAAGGIGLVFYDGFAVDAFVLFTLVTILVGFVFMAIALAFSSAVRSTTLALAGAIGLFVLFRFVWGIALQILWAASHGFDIDFGATMTDVPAWFRFLSAINPITAYDNAARAVIGPLPASPLFAQSNAIYSQNWFSFVVLAFWLLIPLTLGYLRFNSADL